MRKKKGRAAEKKGDKKEVKRECGKLPFWEWEDLPYDRSKFSQFSEVSQSPIFLKKARFILFFLHILKNWSLNWSQFDTKNRIISSGFIVIRSPLCE